MASICIYGAGAVGGYLGGMLGLDGHEVTFAARGARLESLRRYGLTLELESGPRRLAPAVTDAPQPLGPYDLIVLAVKAFHLPEIAPAIPALCHDRTVVLPVMNGLPWWYFLPEGLESVDPGGVIAAHIPFFRCLGAVAYFGSRFAEPATVQPSAAGKLVLGEPDGASSERLATVAGWFARAGLRTETTADIRREIWYKLWGNASFNPVTALTGQGLTDCADTPASCAAVERAMAEIQAVAAGLGITMPGDIAKRIAISRRLGNHPTSTLQDIQARRPTEIDALTGAIAEVARRLSIPTPALDSLTALVKLKQTVQATP